MENNYELKKCLKTLHSALKNNSSVNNIYYFVKDRAISEFENYEQNNKLRYDEIIESLKNNLQLINNLDLDDFDNYENKYVKRKIKRST